jgi:hypothetical protein
MGQVFNKALAEVEETVLSRCLGTGQAQGGQAQGEDDLMVYKQCTQDDLVYLRATLGYVPQRRGGARVSLDSRWGTWAKTVRDMWFDEKFQIRPPEPSSNRNAPCICCGATGPNQCLAGMHVTWGWLVD